MSRSSYSEARDKLSWEAFDYLLGQANLEHQNNFTPELWLGHRVRAVDGSTVQLPKSAEIDQTFAPRCGGFGESYYPYASVFLACDIFTTQVTHSLLGDRFTSERAQLIQMLQSFNPGDIAILDRGLDGRKVWQAFIKASQHFVGRLRVRGCGGLKYDRSKRDQWINIQTDNGATLQVRVVRGPKFKTGNHLFIVTSLLDTQTYTRRDLLALYKKRQAVEDVFLNAKSTLYAKNIRSKKLNGVLQEIFATLTIASMAAGIRYLFERHIQLRRISFKAICWRLETEIGLLVEASSEAQIEHAFAGQERFNHRVQRKRSYPRWSHQPVNKWISEKRRARYYAKKRTQP